ncbi:hypothetical protein KR222_004299, partial [Zaprionus bogoriensis]
SHQLGIWCNFLALVASARSVVNPFNILQIFMAISVPISLTHRNVFLSYNYEYNFYLPEHVYKYPPILMGDFEDSYLTYPTTGDSRQCHNCTVSTNSTATATASAKQQQAEHAKKSARERQKREMPLMTRTTFYSMLSDKLQRSGYPGEACVLRFICETNASSLSENNGVLGNIVHIIFTPTSSRDEQLHESYYQAEADGLQQQCGSYDADCPHNVMDLISVPLERVLQDLASRRRRK